MAMLVVLLIVLSCYVGASSIKDETKTSYFICVSIISVVVVATQFLSS